MVDTTTTGVPMSDVMEVNVFERERALGRRDTQWFLCSAATGEVISINVSTPGTAKFLSWIFWPTYHTAFVNWARPTVTVSRTFGIESAGSGDEDDLASGVEETRRYFLIHKKNTENLTPTEWAELECLQESSITRLDSLPQPNEYDLEELVSLAEKVGVKVPEELRRGQETNFCKGVEIGGGPIVATSPCEAEGSGQMRDERKNQLEH